MKVKIYKSHFKKVTENRSSSPVFFPWDWPELQALDKMWPEESPIEIEIEEDEHFWEQIQPYR